MWRFFVVYLFNISLFNVIVNLNSLFGIWYNLIIFLFICRYGCDIWVMLLVCVFVTLGGNSIYPCKHHFCVNHEVIPYTETTPILKLIFLQITFYSPSKYYYGILSMLRQTKKQKAMILTFPDFQVGILLIAWQAGQYHFTITCIVYSPACTD